MLPMAGRGSLTRRSGTFKNPPPGHAISDVSADSSHQLDLKVEDLHDPVARSNFRVVVILPDQVERVELADPAKARRVVYDYNEERGTWREEEQWP
jgi:pyridoxamine 5'-phosphate oxidase